MAQSVSLAESAGNGGPGSFTGKLAVVTGGGSGMGRELVRQLAAQGCSVAACDLNALAVAEAAAMARAGAPPGVRVTSHACDVSDEAQVLRFRDELLDEHASDHVDLVFSNAGIGGGESFISGSREEWERTTRWCARSLRPPTTTPSWAEWRQKRQRQHLTGSSQRIPGQRGALDLADAAERTSARWPTPPDQLTGRCRASQSARVSSYTTWPCSALSAAPGSALAKVSTRIRLAGRNLHCRPEAELLEPLVVAKEHRDDRGPHLGAGSRLAAIEEAHDLRIAVQLKQVVLVRLGETTQHQTIGHGGGDGQARTHAVSRS